MTGTLTVEEADRAVRLDLSGEDRWHVLLLHRGRPAARVDLASPGEEIGGALLAAAVLRWADAEVARDQLARRLGARLGLTDGAEAPPSLRCSVVICTHRRREDVVRLLASVRELDPAPFEVVIVDNDPGDEDCRAEVLAAGCRYVREDRRGLDNARNAGIEATRGDVVAFTDDDCVVPPGWLARLPGEFANPSVAAVTGPAFPHLLDTPARRRMERQASLARGLRRLEFDWTVFPVAGAGAIGVGANMAFRREALATLGPEPFPAELDAGTATESGGDTYVIARLLARGHRVVYDPATFVYHRHRADARSLHHAFLGYGIGLGAALTRLLVRDGELSTPQTWVWLLSQYRQTQRRRLARRADRVETRLAWDLLRGGLLGPIRWRKALREAKPAPAKRPFGATADRQSPVSLPPLVAAAKEEQPALTVIVPTHERPEALARCLRALSAQDYPAERFEVLVVDDSSEPTAIAPELAQGLRLCIHRSGGVGAAAARNAGAAVASAPLLLFLDDDVVAAPDLVRLHAERQERDGGDAVLVGSYPPRPRTRSFAAMAAVLWWNDFFGAMKQAEIPTYAGALTGNMSISRAAFERIGGFDPRFGRYRREDWEWGLRALKAGVSLGYEPAARGMHEFRLDAPGRLTAARLEGFGDALLLRKHPDAGSAVIPLLADPPSSRSRQAVWRLSLVRRTVCVALALLERGKLRLSWVRLFNIAQRLDYSRGVGEAGGPLPAGEPLVDLDLDRSDPIERPSVAAPTLRVRVGGVEVARVRPALGQWTAGLPEQILTEAPWWAVEQAARSAACFPIRSEEHDHLRHTDVVFDPDGPARDWALTVEAAQREGRSAFVALTMPGIRADAPWLEQALVAFDGPRVGAVLGGGLERDSPPAPLVLHSQASGAADPELEAVSVPRYAVLRRELFEALDASAPSLLEAVLALVEDALTERWVIAYRDVHGLAGEGPGHFAGARALSRARIARSTDPRAAIAGELARAVSLAVWHGLRGSGWRQGAARGAGALAGLASDLPLVLGNKQP